MPFTAQEITDAGKAALDFFVKNKLVDQIGTDRPLLKKLDSKKKTFPGAKQYVTEQLRKSYDSNFQWFNGSDVVTYNTRQNIEQSQFEWRSAHDGFALNEDRLVQNGIKIMEGKGGNSSQAERIQLTNLLDEEIEALDLGFREKFDSALHRDGSASTDAVTGLDAIVSTAPSAIGTLGGIDQVANVWWRNHAAAGLTTTTSTGDILDKMEIAYRACIRNGGKPDFIPVGSDFLDGFRNFMLKTYGRVNYGAVQEKKVEGGSGHNDGTETGLFFHGIQLTWDPVFYDLDVLDAPVIPWEKRCYFLNCNHIKLRPIEGQDMITRKPPRAYNKYEYYWGLTWRGSMTTNRRNAHAVLSIA